MSKLACIYNNTNTADVLFREEERFFLLAA